MPLYLGSTKDPIKCQAEKLHIQPICSALVCLINLVCSIWCYEVVTLCTTELFICYLSAFKSQNMYITFFKKKPTVNILSATPCFDF